MTKMSVVWPRDEHCYRHLRVKEWFRFLISFFQEEHSIVCSEHFYLHPSFLCLFSIGANHVFIRLFNEIVDFIMKLFNRKSNVVHPIGETRKYLFCFPRTTANSGTSSTSHYMNRFSSTGEKLSQFRKKVQNKLRIKKTKCSENRFTMSSAGNRNSVLEENVGSTNSNLESPWYHNQWKKSSIVYSDQNTDDSAVVEDKANIGDQQTGVYSIRNLTATKCAHCDQNGGMVVTDTQATSNIPQSIEDISTGNQTISNGAEKQQNICRNKSGTVADIRNMRGRKDPIFFQGESVSSQANGANFCTEQSSPGNKCDLNCSCDVGDALTLIDKAQSSYVWQYGTQGQPVSLQKICSITGLAMVSDCEPGSICSITGLPVVSDCETRSICSITCLPMVRDYETVSNVFDQDSQHANVNETEICGSDEHASFQRIRERYAQLAKRNTENEGTFERDQDSTYAKVHESTFATQHVGTHRLFFPDVSSPPRYDIVANMGNRTHQMESNSIISDAITNIIKPQGFQVLHHGQSNDFGTSSAKNYNNFFSVKIFLSGFAAIIRYLKKQWSLWKIVLVTRMVVFWAAGCMVKCPVWRLKYLHGKDGKAQSDRHPVTNQFKKN